MARKQVKPRKKKRYNAVKEVKAIARERVGSPPPSRVVAPKDQRKKPKHKQDLREIDLND